jgi:hypothetical protein
MWLGVLVVGALSASFSRTLGVDALTFPSGPASGVAAFTSGGPGWSFVPTTNLMVTSVGYLDLATVGGNPNAVVAIWAGTNTVIASYTGITDPSAQSGDIVLGAIPPLLLAAGQPYTITVYTAPLSGSTWYGSLHDNLGVVQYNPFQVAAELAQYQAWRLKPDGAFAPLSTSPSENQQLLWFGPTFAYQIASLRPVLTIASTNNNSISLTWPTNAVGFVLQSSALVNGAYSNVTNSPSVSGTNYSATLPRTNATAFFRLMKQN